VVQEEGRLLGEDLSVRKSEMQVLSQAGTFLGLGCGTGVEPGRGISGSEQVMVIQRTSGRSVTQRNLRVKKSEVRVLSPRAGRNIPRGMLQRRCRALQWHPLQ
jgi:hypothetical protein